MRGRGGREGPLSTDRENPEGDGEDPDAGDERTVVPRHAVVQDAIPCDHLSEKDAVKAVRQPNRRPATLREAAVVEPQVDHLPQGKDPGEGAHDLQAADELVVPGSERPEGVKDVNGKPNEQRYGDEHAPHTRQ